jgi:phosphate starvation-inducible PhoH-like protein
VVPKSPNQWHYLDAIEKFDIVFGVGPAGTGKTYLAMAQAVSFVAKKVTRIILARPAVEAGEKLASAGRPAGEGESLPAPALRRPLRHARSRARRSPARARDDRGGARAFMRGRTLNDAPVILDEAQNTTSEQMKMFLTRLGFGSKAVITGDVTQIDLPNARVSGLVEALRVVRHIEGISMVHFDDTDVVRHKLVQEIVRAYAEYTSPTPLVTPPPPPGDAAGGSR